MKYTLQKNTIQETLVLPLYGRACCSRKYPHIFPDPLSERAIRQIDYDFSALRIKEFQFITWAVRQRMLNDRAREFLRVHPRGTVIDLGCGLSTGFSSADNGSCRWINLDLPDTIDLRNRLFLPSERETSLAADAFDTAWLDRVEVSPADGVLILCGGVFYYFKPEDIRRLLTALAKRFPGGGIFFDAASSFGAKRANRIVRRTGNEGARMYFSVDDPQALFSSWSPRFKSIRSIQRIPPDIGKCRDIPLPVRLFLNVGFRTGAMKFIELLF